MEKKEFLRLIATSPNVNFLKNDFNITLTFSKLGENRKFNSIIDLYEFLSSQIENWEKYPKIPSDICNVNIYKNFKNYLEDQISKYFNTLRTEVANRAWLENQRSHKDNIYNYCSDFRDNRIQFILKGYTEIDEEIALGAYHYFKKDWSLNHYTGKKIDGLLMAYEFQSAEKSAIFSRTKNELASLKKLEKAYENATSEFNNLHSEHIAKSQEEYLKTVKELDLFKLERVEEYNKWFANTQNTFSDFDDKSTKRVEELEEIYEKKLQLEKPAKYWDKKSKEYLRQAIMMRNIVTAIIAIFGGFLMAILIVSPDRIFLSFSDADDRAKLIKWAILFLLLTSLIVFIIRALIKVMFSSFHLARDAEERHTLTFFYLALINSPKTEINEEERKMIIQSLFSRAETGLLKGDSSPEMPNDIISKFIGK